MGEKGKNAKEPVPDNQLDYLNQYEYIIGVKKVLNDVLAESKLNVTQLAEILTNTYGFNINKGTLRSLFNPNENLNYACLVTVCKYFGLDFNDLLAPKVVEGKVERFAHIGSKLKEASKHSVEEDSMNDAFWKSIAATREKFPVLEADEYTGEFHGYIVPPTGKYRIRRFTLTLEKDNDGIMHATMIRYTSGQRHHNPTKLVFKGVPLLARAYNAVIMFLTSEDKKGEFYFLAFGFEAYRKNQRLIYRQGLAVTGEGLGRSSVIAQSFILFERELSDEDKKYIDGLLKAPNNKFTISVEDAEKLAEIYPEVKKFLEEANDVIERRTKKMLVFREDNILSLDLETLSDFDRIKALLILKGRSTGENKYSYRANSTYTDFALNYLAADKRDDFEESEDTIG